MELDLIRIFVKVVQNGSFSRAALLLKRPKSTVSKAVARLEQESGAKLLLRTTRRLTLTPAGEAFYGSAAPAVQALEEAQKSLEGQDGILSGRVKLTAPDDFGGDLVAPVLAGLTREFPGLSFEVIYSEEVLDLVKDGIDLAVRIGKLPPSALRAKRVGDITMIPVAAPSYAPARKLREPAALKGLDILSYNERSLEGAWALRNGRQSANVKVHPRVSCNQMLSLLELAVGGAGVGLLPDYLCRAPIAEGKLLRVLPGWAGPALPVHLVMPQGAGSSARLKVTAARLEAALRRALGG